MTIPLAVSPSQLTPGLYLVVDLLAGAASPGGGALKVSIMAPKSSAGDLTDDTEVRAGGGADTAATAFGTGSLGHLLAKQVYAKFPAAVVDFISPVSGSGSATLTVTTSGVPTSDNVIDADVMGRTFEVAWLVGESADDVRDKIVDAINQRTGDLAVTAAAGGAGETDIDAKTDGNSGNDVLVKMVLRLPQSGSEAIAGAPTFTNLVGGVTDPDFTIALSNLQGEEYHYIAPGLSNTDVANIATTNNAKRIKDHINGLNTGKDAKLQQQVVGFTGALAAAVATSVDSDSFGNDETGELLLCINGRSLPAEFGGREVGGRLAAISVDPAANRIGELLDGVIGAFDKIADRPSLSESETALGNGVSLVSYTAQGLETLVRAITTHSQDSAGGPDRRLLDTQNVDGAYIVARDIRTALPQEYPNAKITKDTVPGEDPPPQGVIEERDIKTFVLSRLRFFQVAGVVTQASVDAAVADGTLIVQVNPSDSTQVDIVMPFSIVPPLAKTGVVAQRVPN
jgi:phage tail sheath gpL-like